MKITLNSNQAQFIQNKLNSGKYKDVSEIITEALLLLEQRDKNYDQWVQDTKAKIAIGIEQLDNGEGINSTTVINQLKNKIAHLRQTQS